MHHKFKRTMKFLYFGIEGTNNNVNYAIEKKKYAHAYASYWLQHG